PLPGTPPPARATAPPTAAPGAAGSQGQSPGGVWTRCPGGGRRPGKVPGVRGSASRGPGSALSHARGTYACKDRSCVEISKDAVDVLVIGDAERPGVILTYLPSERVYDDFAASPDDAGRAEHTRGELARLRAEKSEAENAEPESIAEARMFTRTVET